MARKRVETMTVWREREPRNGVRICHLFPDCRVLSGKAHDQVAVPLTDETLPTCNGCRTMTSIPGLVYG